MGYNKRNYPQRAGMALHTSMPAIARLGVQTMLFNSFAYALFLPIVFSLYWTFPHRFRWGILLLASYYFYMSWNAKYVALILFTTLVSYLAGRMMEASKADRKKWLVAFSAVVCLGVLFFFKYFNFLSQSVADLLGLFSVPMAPITADLVLPVGISFYTFQTLGYVIDVYRGEVPAERHFGKYAAFISFFPQLVAGPIERTKNLLPQIKAEHHFDYDSATYGLKLMAWGYFKKMVIADGLSPYVGKVFNAPQSYEGFSLVLATFFFTVQIYGDFSGYSDIACGSAKLFGIDLMKNFQSPYFSQSIREFWGRWHISLSSWFRDYVYIPLGGNRVGRCRHYANLMLTFLVSGLWHGANWTFVLWGCVHGIGLVLEEILFGRKENIGILRIFRMICIFVFCAFAWIFFVAQTVTDAWYVITHALIGIGSPAEYLQKGFSIMGMGKVTLFKEACLWAMLSYVDYHSLKEDIISEIGKRGMIIRWGLYVGLALMVLFFSQKGVATEFVYFQF